MNVGSSTDSMNQIAPTEGESGGDIAGLDVGKGFDKAKDDATSGDSLKQSNGIKDLIEMLMKAIEEMKKSTEGAGTESGGGGKPSGGGSGGASPQGAEGAGEGGDEAMDKLLDKIEKALVDEGLTTKQAKEVTDGLQEALGESSGETSGVSKPSEALAA
jgi:hypothetical protein